MKAVYDESFGARPQIGSLPEPSPTKTGVVVKVEATGLCRSDWHGWMGNDPGIRLPHVPGHELAVTVMEVGADTTLNAVTSADVVAAVFDLTDGGAHVSLDALGHPTTFFNSVSNLRKRGCHIQVGLLLADQAMPRAPMAKVIAGELEIMGSHGLQAHRYDEMLGMILSGKLAPEKMVGDRISLEELVDALCNMDRFTGNGATIIRKF